ncbi:zinc finger and BTB domain-containing protein 14-like [Chelmon rostratus]|uniref:zinc finger and BTB domain-containing protein 14-like n=1 Tax=Chelmon rostratus TaxID=109905 RepID=UPI001BE98504|nr:zinc finger and BTB domain-containing protein 14-like [Chelmon rostratus]
MCSVVGCESWRRGAQRFKLPEDPERRLEWVQFLLEVNVQRLKESSWTDITICSEHFPRGCFADVTRTGTVQLKSSAVPSLCLKSESDGPEPHQETLEIAEVASQSDQFRANDTPSSCSEESGITSSAAQDSPEPSDTPDALMYDYAQMLQKIVNIDAIREKAALLQMKGKYVVNENRLLQLFSSKCPLCGSKVKVEKVTCGLLIILNQQCLQCEYRDQWKSQVNASVPAAEGSDLSPESKQTASAHAFINEEGDPTEETEESGDEGGTDSDEDWNPKNEISLDGRLLKDESDEESESESDNESYDYPPLALKHSQLCTECGKFFNKQRSHTCEHKIKPFSCNICGKRCVSEVALNCHSRVHDENYEHRCKYCHATFKTKVDKRTHEQTHVTEGKPYKCPDCSETFATNKDRSIHLEDHRGPRQLKCDICGIEFYRPLSLQRHLAVHTGAKPFKCSVCQRGFNQASHLKSHMRLHTGERPYKCQHCDKCFNHNVSLKSHVQRYHTPGSGCEQKKDKKNKTASNTVDAQGNGNKKVQEERTDTPKSKRRSTGRPIGRPKRSDSSAQGGGMKGRSSNTKTAKVKVRKLKRTRCSDEQSEGEPTESDASLDSAQREEEGREKVTWSTSRVRGRARKDFNPEDSEKKRCSGKGSGKRLGRPRKTQVVEDT